MRGLIVCFAIGCLALASGAPTEDSKVNTKSFKFDKKEFIYSFKPFSNDELVYAVCEPSSSEDKKCKVYVESVNEGSTAQSCDVTLNYGGRADFHVSLYNAGKSRAVIAERDGVTKIKLIIVNLKGCQIKEASVEVPQQLTKNEVPPLKAVVVPHENTFDLIYKNHKICDDNLCKATFDFEGKQIKSASSFLLRDLDFSLHQVEPAKDAYLVGEFEGLSGNVYLIHDGDKQAKTLLSEQITVLGLSTEENKIGYCTYVNKKLQCKQYDIEAKEKKIEVEIATGDVRVDSLDVYNLEKGLVALMVGAESRANARSIVVVSFDEQGKQNKYNSVDLKCDSNNAVLSNLYKNSNGEFCASTICIPRPDGGAKTADFSRSTKCFTKAELS